jgi:cation diffusion facilitator CzcD-associated flavoprotein CzcO
MHSGRAQHVAVIGAGVSGLATGLALQRAGVPFTIFEKAAEVGGTWRDNRYPGLTIDVPAPLYTFAEDRNPGWRRWMPDGPEILAYHRDVSVRRGLREHIRFDTEVTAATWTGEQWDVRTAAAEQHAFDAVICATGFLHHPRVPDIPGLGEFAGDCVHSARWDDSIAVRGRRVGVIGTGSTGVQLVSALGGVASHVTLFQRSAQWIYPGPNFGIPRAVRALFARHPRFLAGLGDGIESFADVVLGGATRRAGLRRRLFEVVGRLHLATVRDPQLRATLTPEDASLCRRPVLSNRFYRAVQRPDVSVVADGIERVVPEGVVTTDGRLHELDVLILATGFRAHDYMRPIAITGEDGLTLDEAWATGPHGYRTVALTGFPNLFMILGPHSPLVSISIHRSAELQAAYVVQLLELLAEPDVVSVAPTADATQRWLEYIRAGMPETVWATGCASWYRGSGETPVLWPYDVHRWREALRQPQLEDFEVRRVAVPEPVA